MIPYLRLMGCKRWQNYLLIALSVLTLFFLTTNLDTVRWGDAGTADEKRAVELFRAKYGEKRLLETSVRLMDGAHVDICDSVMQMSNKRVIGREIVTTYLRLTVIKLLPPPGLNEDNIDTRTWRIDRTTLNLGNYVTTMIEEMFLSGKVPMSKLAYAKILDLGLGGGYLNSFLHHNYPNLDITVVEYDREILKIARKWFDLKEDTRHRVILSDATSFLRNAANNGQMYDIIFVDACGAKVDSWIICPNERFTAPDMPQIMAKLLTENGALIMNVLSAGHKPKNTYNNLKRIYNSAFKHCIFKQSHSQSNLVMTCMQHTPPKNLAPQYEKFANYEKYGSSVSELFQ